MGQSYCVSSVTFRKCKKNLDRNEGLRLGCKNSARRLVTTAWFVWGGGLVTTDQKMSVGYWTIWRSRRPHAVYLLVTNRMLNRSGTDHYINRGVIYVTCFVTVSSSLILVDINHGYQLLFHMLSFNLNITVKMSHRSMNLNMPDTFTMHTPPLMIKWPLTLCNVNAWSPVFDVRNTDRFVCDWTAERSRSSFVEKNIYALHRSWNIAR